VVGVGITQHLARHGRTYDGVWAADDDDDDQNFGRARLLLQRKDGRTKARHPVACPSVLPVL